MAILESAKHLAREYRNLTGKPLGITGEVAEFEAARILKFELTPARNEGYDAIEHLVDGSQRTVQVKGRCMPKGCKSGRLSKIQVDKEWDVVLMVLLDENFDATEMYEADREPVVAALTAPGSISRNQRGALPISKFKAIGRLRWRRSI